MGFKLRDIAATAGRYVRQAARMAGRGALAALAYLLDAIDWALTWIATGCMAVADLAEDAAVRLRRCRPGSSSPCS